MGNATSVVMMSPGQIREFIECGYVVLNDFISPQTVWELTNAVERLEPDENSSRLRRGVVFARRNMLQLDLVRRLIHRLEVTEVVNELAPGCVPVRAILFDKTGKANWTAPWHQDRSIAVRSRVDLPGFGPWSRKAGVIHVQPPVEIMRQMLTLRLHLDACDSDNGPLRVIAGTHEQILSHDEVESLSSRAAHSECITGAGGLVLIRPLILHASSPAITPGHRRVIHIEYGPAHLPGGLSWAMA